MIEFDNREDVERWLKNKPREIAVLIAARAALRVVPVLALAESSRSEREIVLPVLRASSAAWVATQSLGDRIEFRAAAYAALSGIEGVVSGTGPVAAAIDAARAAVAAAANSSVDYTFTERNAVDAAAAAYAAAYDIAYELAYGPAYDARADAGALESPERVAASAGLEATYAALTRDARTIDDNVPWGLVSERPLWIGGSPAWVSEKWRELRARLLNLDSGWNVWTDWYDRRLQGIRSDRALEFARVLIANEIWNEGPGAVNAEIKRLIAEHDRKPLGLAPSELASDEHEIGLLSEDKLFSEEDRLLPPADSLPAPHPATRFAFANGQFDVLPSTIWQRSGTQAAIYHAKALALATTLADRLEKTDAVPDAASSVLALIDVLGDHVSNVQPDQLRLASRSIAAKARAFGHPSAQWEISPESVGSLFELADVLTDLQSFARGEIEAHESAIRELDLNARNVAEAKAGLDLVSQGVLASVGMITERVEIAFESAAAVSDAASDGQVKIDVEGDRTLLTANFALAVARQLGRDAEGKDDSGPTLSPPKAAAALSPEKSERRRRRRKSKRPSNEEHSWEEFADRFMERIHKKGPDAMADATLQAAASAIKHGPKTAAALGAVLVAWSISNPIVLAGGGIAATMAWIGYELRCRNMAKKK